MPPLVEIGLADLPKSGGAQAPPGPPLATGLYTLLSASCGLVALLILFFCRHAIFSWALKQNFI